MKRFVDNLLLRKLLLHIPAAYRLTDAGIVRIGTARDIAAYAIGDFRGKCLIFCHGNGETAVSERHWFEQLAAAGGRRRCRKRRCARDAESNA